MEVISVCAMLRTIYVDYVGESVDGDAEKTAEGKMKKKNRRQNLIYSLALTLAADAMRRLTL